MNVTKSLAVTFAVALATFLLAGGLARPTPLGAEEGPEAFVIPTATLAVDGLVIAADFGEAAPVAGGKARVRLAVSNPEGLTLSTDVRVRVTSSPPVSPMARMIPMPTEIHAETVTLDLRGEASRTVVLDLGEEVSDGATLTVHLAHGDEDEVLAATATFGSEETVEDEVLTQIERAVHGDA